MFLIFCEWYAGPSYHPHHSGYHRGRSARVERDRDRMDRERMRSYEDDYGSERDMMYHHSHHHQHPPPIHHYRQSHHSSSREEYDRDYDDRDRRDHPNHSNMTHHHRPSGQGGSGTREGRSEERYGRGGSGDEYGSSRRALNAI